MKVINSVLVFAAAALVATTSPVRAAEPEPEAAAPPAAPEKNDDAPARNLHSDEQFEEASFDVKRYPDPDPNYKKYYYYYTGSCSCVGDAIDDILDAGTKAIEKIPFDDATHEFLMDYIDGLVHCAIEFLHGLDCGCDHDYHIPQQRALTYPRLTVSTYACCCDVEAIKEGTIHQIEAIACSWNVDMFGHYMGATVEKLCNFEYYEKIYARLEYFIEQVGGQYLKALFGYPPSAFTCEVPDLECPVVPTLR